MLHDNFLVLAKQAYNKLKDEFGDIYLNAYLFGSISKGLVKETSDIDILMLGNKEKSIELVSKINNVMEGLSQEPEINVLYYNINKFKELRNSGNLFIKSIEKDCIRLEDIDELL